MNTSLDPSKGIAIFSDGSSNHQDRTGGWAWVALDAFDGMKSGRGHRRDTTNNQMELYAPAEALRNLQKAFGPIEALVFSDSEYVVQGITDRTRKRNKNRWFWKRLDEAVDAHTYVEFEHIRGHAGHRYNEMADKLAGQARASCK